MREGRRYVIPIEPMVSLILLGLLLIGASFYYRAVNLQRFLEPALAVLQPNANFSLKLRDALLAELGDKRIEGITLVGNTIRVHKSLLPIVKDSSSSHEIFSKLGNAFSNIFADNLMNKSIDLILVTGKISLPEGGGVDVQEREMEQNEVELILDALFKHSPELRRSYSHKFSASAVTSDLINDDKDWVEFNIIPSERLHVEVLQRLQKYTQ